MTIEPWTGLRVVDLYAGSGALGIEALSRGAAFVDFAESSRHALEALEDNVESLGIAERTRVWRVALPAGLARMRECLERADVVLMDPPYGGDEARRALESLGRAAALAPQCRVVLEHHAKDDMPPETAALERIAERRYGETQITYYGPRREDDARTREPGA